MPGGRPTEYSKKLLDKAKEYLTVYESEGDKIPSHIGLALYVGISKTCLYDWAKDESKNEFSDILQQCSMMQHQKLINNGLDNTFNSNITKLVLGKHNYHERTEHSGPEGKPIPVVAVDMTADEAANIYNDIID